MTKKSQARLMRDKMKKQATQSWVELDGMYDLGIDTITNTEKEVADIFSNENIRKCIDPKSKNKLIVSLKGLGSDLNFIKNSLNDIRKTHTGKVSDDSDAEEFVEMMGAFENYQKVFNVFNELVLPNVRYITEVALDAESTLNKHIKKYQEDNNIILEKDSKVVKEATELEVVLETNENEGETING